jgi:tetratricopeptide (TPR) repeat protein
VFAGQGENISATQRLKWAPVAIFCCALLVRLIFLAENRNVIFFNYRGIDAQQFHEMAVGFLNGTWPDGKVFSWPPLYPLFLGLLYKTIGQNAAIVKMLQSVLGSVSCVLVYFIARIIFSGRFVPIAAAIICCLCGTLVYFDCQLLSGSLDVLLELLIIFSLLCASRHRRLIWWSAAGLFVGLSAINRGAMLLFLPLILFWMYMVRRYRWGIDREFPGPVFWKAAVALLLPAVLVISPVVLHNVRYDNVLADNKPGSISFKRFVATGFFPIAYNLGINFYLGNHWELRKINNINHPEHFIYFHRINDEPAEKGIEGAFAQSRFLVRQTLKHILEKPADFIKMMALKVFQLFNGAEIPRNANIYAFRRYSVVLSILLWKKIIAFPSGLIIPLGLVGIFLIRHSWRKHFLLLSCLAIQYLFILAFFVTARYRLPTIPLLTVYAAFALGSFIHYVKQGPKRKLTVPLILLAALLLFSNSFTGKIETEHGYSEQGNVGNALLEKGNIDEAILHYKEALKLAPDYSETNVRLANALSKKGRIDEAVILYKKALQHMTDCNNVPYNPLIKKHRTACYEVHRYLADDLVRLGGKKEAVEHYVTSLDLNPDQPETHYNLANVLMDMGRLDEAYVHYNEALELKPDHLEARSNLAKLLVEQGKLAEAIEQWQQLVQTNPDEPVVHNNLATAYYRLGDFDKAISHWKSALRLNPDNVSVLGKLAWLLAACNNAKYRDPSLAVELAEHACELTNYSAPKLLDTLAAAYASSGRFDDAVKTAQKALAILSGVASAKTDATTTAQKDLASNITQRLNLYHQHQPYLE